MDDNRVIRSSANIFADLGFDDPELEQAKASLARRIRTTIEQRGLTQTAAAEVLEIPPSNLSRIVRGRPGEFSIERLIRLLRRFDQDVEIVVSPADQSGRPVTSVVDQRRLATWLLTEWGSLRHRPGANVARPHLSHPIAPSHCQTVAPGSKRLIAISAPQRAHRGFGAGSGRQASRTWSSESSSQGIGFMAHAHFTMAPEPGSL